MHKVSCWLSWIKGVCGWLFCEIQPSQQWSSAETSSSINDKAISTNVTVPAMHFHNVYPDFAPLSVFAAGTWHSNASLPAVTTISPSRRVNSDCYVNCNGLKQKQTSMPCCIQVQDNYDKKGRFKGFVNLAIQRSHMSMSFYFCCHHFPTSSLWCKCCRWPLF